VIIHLLVVTEAYIFSWQMGIVGLLKYGLPQFMIKQARVGVIAAMGFTSCVVDFSDWFHVALYIVSVFLMEGDRPKAIAACIKFFWQRLQMLAYNGIKRVHFVRDGRSPLTKVATNTDRGATRAAAVADAERLRARGGSDYRKACNKAVKREPRLALAICESFPQFKADMAVTSEIAMYEADGQIGHLLTLGLFDFGIVNDQDIAIYGANRLMFKLGNSKSTKIP
jgi:hypothetical protein